MSAIKEVCGCENPDIHKYDAFEVEPVRQIAHGDGTYSMEVTSTEDPDIHCWSVYGHRRKEGHVDCLADCSTKDVAESIACALNKTYLTPSHISDFGCMIAMEAIAARINGEFDNPALLEMGCLSDTTSDILRIIERTRTAA